MNFNSTTFPSERNLVKNLLKDSVWITKEENIHWQDYYKSLENSKFCIQLIESGKKS